MNVSYIIKIDFMHKINDLSGALLQPLEEQAPANGKKERESETESERERQRSLHPTSPVSAFFVLLAMLSRWPRWGRGARCCSRWT